IADYRLGLRRISVSSVSGASGSAVVAVIGAVVASVSAGANAGFERERVEGVDQDWRADEHIRTG
ncbi:MAG TPA: hypothetical protein VHH12_07995, partial [Mycobacterium sp.]|nr:hypothetical protein [Mycobacterium sp.]